MLVIELLGTLSLRADAGAVPLVATTKATVDTPCGPRPWRKQGLSRQRIESYLLGRKAMPTAAGHALTQAVYAIRKKPWRRRHPFHRPGSQTQPPLIGVDVWFFAKHRRQGLGAGGEHLQGQSSRRRGISATAASLESLSDANRTRLRQEFHKRDGISRQCLGRGW